MERSTEKRKRPSVAKTNRCRQSPLAGTERYFRLKVIA
jgi:hypothetical protein